MYYKFHKCINKNRVNYIVCVVIIWIIFYFTFTVTHVVKFTQNYNIRMKLQLITYFNH